MYRPRPISIGTFVSYLHIHKAPISKFPPRVLTAREIEATIQDYAHCASLAKEAG